VVQAVAPAPTVRHADGAGGTSSVIGQRARARIAKSSRSPCGQPQVPQQRDHGRVVGAELGARIDDPDPSPLAHREHAGAQAAIRADAARDDERARRRWPRARAGI
jgi:hypothetical protein